MPYCRLPRSRGLLFTLSLAVVGIPALVLQRASFGTNGINQVEVSIRPTWRWRRYENESLAGIHDQLHAWGLEPVFEGKHKNWPFPSKLCCQTDNNGNEHINSRLYPVLQRYAVFHRKVIEKREHYSGGVSRRSTAEV